MCVIRDSITPGRIVGCNEMKKMVNWNGRVGTLPFVFVMGNIHMIHAEDNGRIYYEYEREYYTGVAEQVQGTG